MGDEPDADQRLDAEIPPSGAASRGRYSGAGGGWRVEVGGFTTLRGIVGCAHEGMDGRGPIRARHHGGAQIDGIHISEHLVLVAALGIDSEGIKHPLGLMEGATEHSAVVQALIDDLIERGLDPDVPRLFIIDGSKALAKAIRRNFGRHTPIQRCQIHKARNIMERLSPALHASVRRVLRQAWELDDAEKAEKLIRNLARRLEHDAPGVSKSILEGLDEILTVSRLGLPAELRRSLACTNIIENMMSTVRRVTRNVKRWSSPSMALRWTAAAMHEAKKGFRKLKAFRQLPGLRAALAAHYEKQTNNRAVAQIEKAA